MTLGYFWSMCTSKPWGLCWSKQISTFFTIGDLMEKVFQHIETEVKWPNRIPFSCFIKFGVFGGTLLLNFFPKVYLAKNSFGLDDVLLLTRWHTIIWTNDGLVYWCIIAYMHHLALIVYDSGFLLNILSKYNLSI